MPDQQPILRVHEGGHQETSAAEVYAEAATALDTLAEATTNLAASDELRTSARLYRLRALEAAGPLARPAAALAH